MATEYRIRDGKWLPRVLGSSIGSPPVGGGCSGDGSGCGSSAGSGG